ncbi:minor capsid protein [Bacillus phage vB_BceS_LY5]|uniref:minor capsid protein n=1 Tax=Bacillus phage vB_BceS_LY5 TaxID=2996058 RepID=UPI004054C066|nr:minor capsid protein [Bacillus phage vB_BceS_LY5]
MNSGGRTIHIDVLPAENSIALRLVPTAPSPALLIGKNESRQIQILVKNEDQRAAMQTIDEITEQYEDLQQKQYIPYNGKYRMIRSSVYTEPSFVDKIDNRYYVYTAILNFEMERMN